VSEKPFPSAQVVVAAALAERLPYLGHVGTWLPTDLRTPGVMPAVQVIRRGGFDDGVTDTSRLDIYVLAPGEEATEKAAEEIRLTLTTQHPIRGDGRMVDGCSTEVAPHRVPYADELIVQYNATFVATARRMLL
jgi:hypothetical protein